MKHYPLLAILALTAVPLALVGCNKSPDNSDASTSSQLPPGVTTNAIPTTTDTNATPSMSSAVSTNATTTTNAPSQ